MIFYKYIEHVEFAPSDQVFQVYVPNFLGTVEQTLSSLEKANAKLGTIQRFVPINGPQHLFTAKQITY